MFSIYLVNNDLNNTGFEQNVQSPEIQGNQQALLNQNPSNGNEETLPALPQISPEITVSNKNPSEATGSVNIPFIAILIIIVLIFVVLVVKILGNPNKNNKKPIKQKSKKNVVSEVVDSNIKSPNKSYATPTNIKKCIKLFLENTRIR